MSDFQASIMANALASAGVTGEPVSTPTLTPAPVAPATLVRIQPLRYSDAQAFAFWTARKTEEKASAYWSAVAPIMSAYLVNGGTSASIRNTGKAVSPFAAHIWANKTRKDRAAQAAFMECAKMVARSCEHSQADHDDCLSSLELAFYAVLSPREATARKPQATRYTVAQFCEALRAGQLSSDDMASIAKALPDYIEVMEPA